MDSFTGLRGFGAQSCHPDPEASGEGSQKELDKDWGISVRSF